MSNQIFNERFLYGGRPPIKVIKNHESWVINQRFENPWFKPGLGPWSNDRCNIPYVDVKIVIDFVSIREDTKIKIEIPQFGFLRRSEDPYELFNGYPLDKIACWLTPAGENLSSWGSRVCSNGAIRPTERQLYNGRTRSEIRNENERKELKTQISYRR